MTCLKISGNREHIKGNIIGYKLINKEKIIEYDSGTIINKSIKAS